MGCGLGKGLISLIPGHAPQVDAQDLHAGIDFVPIGPFESHQQEEEHQRGDEHPKEDEGDEGSALGTGGLVQPLRGRKGGSGLHEDRWGNGVWGLQSNIIGSLLARD